MNSNDNNRQKVIAYYETLSLKIETACKQYLEKAVNNNDCKDRLATLYDNVCLDKWNYKDPLQRTNQDSQEYNSYHELLHACFNFENVQREIIDSSPADEEKREREKRQLEKAVSKYTDELKRRNGVLKATLCLKQVIEFCFGNIDYDHALECISQDKLSEV